MSRDASRCLRVMIGGLVQGVCFRHYTRQKAIELGISGWVKNLPDGHVEALICGIPTQIDIMLGWLAHGPDTAKVTSCAATPAEASQAVDGFHILH